MPSIFPTQSLFFCNIAALNLNILLLFILCLTSDSDPYWAHADYSLYTCREKTLVRENLMNRLPAFGTCLLGAYLAPAGHLWYSTSLLFGHLGNHCCRNKPMDELVSLTCSTTVESLGGTCCLPHYS